MIKNHANCDRCKYDGFGVLCQTTDCSKCKMNYNIGLDTDPECRCNLIDNDDDCPYFEEAKDE